MDLSDLTRIQTLKPRLSPYWQTLEYCRHLGVQVHPHGGVYWVARVRKKNEGQYAQHRLSAVDFENVHGVDHRAALALAIEWFHRPGVLEMAADAYPVGACQQLRYSKTVEGFTVGDAMYDYVEWKRVAAARTHFETNLSLINHHIIPRLGDFVASELKPKDVTRFVRDVLESPPKLGNQQPGPSRPLGTLDAEELRKRKKTANTLLGILRLALQMAWENGEIGSSRCWRSIRRLPHRDAPRNVILSRPECSLLIEQCREDLRLLVLGALYTGCRVSELSTMVVADFDANARGVHVAPGKSRYRRFVYLPREGLEFFHAQTECRRPDDLMFRMNSGRAWNCNHKQLFKDAVRSAGLPERFVFHGLRHTYASQLVQSGTPLAILAKQLGHAGTDTVSRTYGHLSFASIGEQLEMHFDTLLGGQREAAENPRAPDTDSNGWPRSNFARAGREQITGLK